MKMEELQKELEEMRSAMEKLTEEHRAKSILSESLRRAHDAELAKLQEAKAEVANQAREIEAKADEISLAKQMYEDLRSSFSQKESVVKQLSAVNENLKNSFREELASSQSRNKELVCALDEANAERGEQKRMICAYREEIDRLKSLLLLSQKKCSDAESQAQAPKEMSRRDDMLFELEQEKGRIEEKLKWKNEQFRHLEEALNKTQVEFRGAKKEWELDRSNLFDEINTLQLNLDSQTRVVGELRSQLQMCNQALAREESRRKLLEIRVSESKALYENVVVEYEEARSSLERLTTGRDEEIATLRNSLATKATLLKETEFSRTHLELENQDLKKSLKEFQEAQINDADAAYSLKNLRLKFRSLEQVHRDCSEKLKAREVEWTTLTEKLGKDLHECMAKLISKDKQISELQFELEGSCASLMQQKLESEVIAIVHLGLESELLISCANLEKSKIESEQYCANIEERIGILMEEMEKKNSVIIQAQAAVNKRECGTVDSSETRADYQKLNDLQDDLKKALDALDLANSAIVEKTSEVHKVEFELQQLKTVVEQTENLKSDMEIELAKYCAESDELRRNMEVSFRSTMQAEKALVEKDKIIDELQNQLVLLEKHFSRRESEGATLANLAVEKANKRLLEVAGDLEKKIEGVSSKLDFMEQKYEEAIAEASMNLGLEEATILSLEQEFTSSVETAVAFKVADKQVEVDTVYEALERIARVHVIAEHEIQYKRIVIDEMEQEINTLQLLLLAEEKQSFDLKDHLCRLKAEKIVEKLERDGEKIQGENELKSMRINNRALEGQILQLILEKEELVRQMREFNDLIGESYQKDEALAKNWERVVKKAKNDDETARYFEGEDFLSRPKVEGGNFISPSRNTAGQNYVRRLPLKEYNS